MSKLRKTLARLRRLLFGNNRILENIVESVSPILDFIFPKDNYTIVLGSNSTRSVTGSPKAMFERIQKEHPRFNAYFITKNPKRQGEIKANTLHSLLVFLRARYLVSSHGLTDFGIFRFSRRKKMIATWHGVALKGCGYEQKNLTKHSQRNLEEYVGKTTFCISSSEYDSGILRKMFGYSEMQMKTTGRPRNDPLMVEKKREITLLKKILPQLQGDETVILYGPTFRDKEMVACGKDLRLFPFEDITGEKLDKFLSSNNIIILIRGHINETSMALSFASNRVIEFSTTTYENVNDILPEVDILITDYSSMAYDFLLLDRPIYFFPYDIEDYTKYRGLIVDDYDYWTPGPKIFSFAKFTEEVQKYLSGVSDGYEQIRNEMTKIVHSHQTEDSTSIILQILIES